MNTPSHSKPPLVAVLDVNETLSDMTWTRRSAEGCRGGRRAAADLFAATLRDRSALDAVAGMAELDLHPDVAGGLQRLADAGVRIVTLSNGAAAVAESLLERAGLRHLVEGCLDQRCRSLEASP